MEIKYYFSIVFVTKISMELTINTNSFTDYLHMHKKSNRNRGSITKRLRAKSKNTLLAFNEWFEKEHDYCLPIKKRSEVSLKYKYCYKKSILK